MKKPAAARFRFLWILTSLTAAAAVVSGILTAAAFFKPYTVYAPPGERPVLPDGLIYMDAEPGTEPEADFLLILTRSMGASSPGFVLHSRFWVPVVPPADSRRSVMSADLDHVKLMPLEDVGLPWKMTAYDSLYPGDEGYPLIEWFYWTLEDGGKKERFPAQASEQRRVRFRQSLLDVMAEYTRSRNELQPPEILHVAAVGDIMPGRGFDTVLAGENGPLEALGDVLPLLSRPDLLIGNLETAVTESREAWEKSFTFKVSSRVLSDVTELGFDFYHLANNHSWDYGERGFLDTLKALDEVGAGYSGAGMHLEEARFAWEWCPQTRTGSRYTASEAGNGESGSSCDEVIRILSVGAYYPERNGFNGERFAAAGWGKPGVLWDSPENEEFIRSVLGRDDAFTVVTVHGGYEWEDVPREQVRLLYRRYVDWGADLVLAHHPHVLQGVEHYRDGLIAYSLGNFIFPGMTGWSTGEETGVLEFRIFRNRIIGMDFQPVRINGRYLRRAEGESIAGRFWDLTSALNGSP